MSSKHSPHVYFRSVLFCLCVVTFLAITIINLVYHLHQVWAYTKLYLSRFADAWLEQLMVHRPDLATVAIKISAESRAARRAMVQDATRRSYGDGGSRDESQFDGGGGGGGGGEMEDDDDDEWL